MLNAIETRFSPPDLSHLFSNPATKQEQSDTSDFLQSKQLCLALLLTLHKHGWA